MRLLDTETGRFADFPDESKVPSYAILSHTWDPQGEQTYQELRTIRPITPSGVSLSSATITPPATTTSLPPFSDDPVVSAKIRMACVNARAYGHRYIWIDSCCIDKSSSTELSEAINSMYRWYGKATVCYAFLADVSSDENTHDTASQIRRSRWFTRGWTLQELIAPRHVVFLSQEWRILGSKSSLAPLLEEVSGIERAVLTHEKQLDAVSVAARMSWASMRSTTRAEDEAYSLLGIFDINMPTLYGEGRRAFARLQEEIVRQIPDQSLFAWGNVYLYSRLTPLPAGYPSDIYASSFLFELDHKAQSFFAPSPSHFKHSGSIRAVPLEVANRSLGLLNNCYTHHPIPIPSYTVTPYGIRTDLLLLDAGFLHGSPKMRINVGRWFLAILACTLAQRDGELLARVCYMRPTSSETDLLRGGLVRRRVPSSLKTATGFGSSVPHSMVSMSIRAIQQHDNRWRQHTCYIPYLRLGHQELQTQPSRQRRWVGQCTLPEWQKAVLQLQGYVVMMETGTPLFSSDTDQYHLTLSGSNHTIMIEYQCRPVLDPDALDSDAEVALSGPDLGTAHSGSSSLRSSNIAELTVWLDVAVVPSSTSPHAFELNGVGQEARGPHEWVDFCTERFEFPEIILNISQSADNGGTRIPRVRMTRKIRLKVAIEPVTEEDPNCCSHHILVELEEHEQVEELQDSPSEIEPEPERRVEEEEKGGGSWVAKLGKRFKSRTRT
ncbi:hypothetical protein GSI_10653 [Ganoderma sinense ZZ0214-1]|uniref:Uncharacterized protein n=1 Tax=Ganoderma sinense ZZ0214-1 TaxID=1077348 RepID=A0A2G8S155_9APHY|nr:hypothetical protein GSI_10653 [Ganoderma sinense ZZ0214-1]